jgi:hypothetical protein
MKLYPILFEIKHPNLSEKTSTIDEVQKVFQHFHLSRKFLGEPTFTFTPRIPSLPYQDRDGNTIEDDITPRISLAADIEDARDALAAYGTTYYYVYAVQQDNNIEQVENNIANCPAVPPKSYNVRFNIKKWLRKTSPDTLQTYKTSEEIKPSNLPANLKTKFAGCVPDSTETHEEWSREPLRMLFIGTIGEAGDTVQLSTEAARIMAPRSI